MRKNFEGSKIFSKKKFEYVFINTLDLALKRRAIWMVERLNPKDGDKILDLGCGDGYYLNVLSKLGLKLNLVGMDNDKRALKSAKKNLSGRKIHLVYGDLSKKLPFKSSSFDKVVMSEVLEHLENDKKALFEIYRILKSGGRLIISVPNANYPFLWDPINWLLERLFNFHIKTGFWAGIWNQHLRLYKITKIEDLIKKSPFKLIECKTLTFWSLPFNHYTINLGARILSKNDGRKGLIKGSDKFDNESSMSLPVYLYKIISGFVDRLNDKNPPINGGVSIVAYAKK